MADTNRHVAVIGAGIVGISVAAFLQRHGLKVTVIDRVAPGMGCSFGNAGGVVVSGVMPTVYPGIFMKIPGWLIDPEGPLTIRWSYLPKVLPWMLAQGRAAMPDRVAAITQSRAMLCGSSLDDHKSLLKEAGAEDLLVLRDGIHLFDRERDYRGHEAVMVVRAAYGYDCKRLTPGEIGELEPDIAPDFACGIFRGGWYHVRNPHTVVARIAATVAGHGGTILQDEVSDFVIDDNHVSGLRLAGGGELDIDGVVVAAGAWSHLWARRLGIKVLLEAERGYHLTIPDPGVSISRAITRESHPGAISPMDVGLRVAGTDEFAGLDAPEDWRRADVLWHNAKRILPGLREIDASVSKWMGRRPGTPDSLPVIDRAPDHANVWFAFGHGHMGLTWGPTTGRLIASLVAGVAPNSDLRAFRITRF
jgi:D-amino-acid dehydrogenase